MCLIKIPALILLVYLKSAELEQLILYLMHINSAEVQLKIYLSIFNCAKVELLQLYFKYLAFKDRYYLKIIQPSSIVTLKF